ncbi:MAG: hypothetical protein R2700_03560 [Solirubrobacterales bacterium]
MVGGRAVGPADLRGLERLEAVFVAGGLLAAEGVLGAVALLAALVVLALVTLVVLVVVLAALAGAELRGVAVVGGLVRAVAAVAGLLRLGARSLLLRWSGSSGWWGWSAPSESSALPGGSVSSVPRGLP